MIIIMIIIIYFSLNDIIFSSNKNIFISLLFYTTKLYILYQLILKLIIYNIFSYKITYKNSIEVVRDFLSLQYQQQQVPYLVGDDEVSLTQAATRCLLPRQRRHCLSRIFSSGGVDPPSRGPPMCPLPRRGVPYPSDGKGPPPPPSLTPLLPPAAGSPLPPSRGHTGALSTPTAPLQQALGGDFDLRASVPIPIQKR